MQPFLYAQSAAETALNEAKGAAKEAVTTFESAKKAQEASERKEKEAQRARTRKEYEAATAEKDATVKALNAFKERVGDAEWTPDDEAEYAELDHAAYEAHNRYELASVAMQTENAAEVAKAKAAAREAEMIKREEDEAQREVDLALIFEEQKEFSAKKEETNARITQIKGDYEFATDEEKEKLLQELTEAKEKVKEFE